jgi:hypothetical protein
MQASFCSLSVEGTTINLEDLTVVFREKEDRWAKGAHGGLLLPT